MTDPILSDLRRIAQTYPTRGTQDAVIAAVDEIQRLRSDLAAARDEAKISEDALQSACVKALNERDQLRQNLAAARALLRDCRSLVRCESLDHYRKADQHDGFGPCPIEMRMKDAIDAALAAKEGS